MIHKIFLRNTLTGETRTYDDDFDWPSDNALRFQYFEGNYSCDCNRSLMMHDHDQSKKLECSAYENVIAIDKILREDGTEVPHD